ncbi:PIG-L deacetylase family protein [Streptomyces sp. NPDC012693]|jgi:LmbE family N-acetylglucosaminyl deacetylase|uniref:PIG-L deacetylase family protein n=1 Tax=unclassified Streptomyces TaxID=2593676 RepID=UPI00202E1825|nr:PIG-L deacetylase family protein [Streptomyces sp. MSC1_001]
MTERILVVAAHPDDEVLGMGGTIAKHALHEGAQVTVLCVTDGSSSQYPGDRTVLELKHEEARRAAKLLGVHEYLQRDLPDMRLDAVPHVEINAVVEQAVRDVEPHTVYTVHPDVNMDHRAVFRSVMVATRPRTDSPVRRVLSYAPISSVEWTPPFEATFTPTWFSDITDTLDAKVAAFECYETETRPWPHPRSSRAIRAHAAACGSGVGRDAAEPFVLVRMLHD